MKVGWSWPYLQHLLFEHLGGGSPSEAFAGRGVETVAEDAEVRICDMADVDVARQPAAGAAVGVLDCAFLPGRGRIAEPAGGADLGLEVRPGDELGASIKGDGFAGVMRQVTGLTSRWNFGMRACESAVGGGICGGWADTTRVPASCPRDHRCSGRSSPYRRGRAFSSRRRPAICSGVQSAVT